VWSFRLVDRAGKTKSDQAYTRNLWDRPYRRKRGRRREEQAPGKEGPSSRLP